MPTNSEGYVSQEYHPYNSSNTYWRNYDTHSGTWSTWKLKTTDLSTYNAPTATKLATPIKLWGARIDGTQNYEGSLTLMNNTAINGTTEDGKVEHCLIPRWSDGKTYFNFGSTGLVVRNNGSDVKMVILPDGNMGIGTGNPQSKLDVFGNVSINSKLVISDDTNSNYVIFGQGTRDTYVRGNNIHF